jgi:hypothetical protein
MICHSSVFHQEVPGEVLALPVTGMGVDEASTSVALPEPKETRPLPRQGPLERSKPQQLLLEEAMKSMILGRQRPEVHRNIKS